MKIFVAVLCLVLPVAAFAQNPNMQGADMAKMMELMQAMQECMAKVDQSELEALSQRAEEFDAELRELCAQGKKDEARERAMAYSQEMMKNPTLIQMKECGEMTKGMVPEGMMPPAEERYDYTDRDICDE